VERDARKNGIRVTNVLAGALKQTAALLETGASKT
jgi:hypothetical protein